MIRNIVAFALPHGWPHLAVETAELLSRRQFQPCGPLDIARTGFVAPRDEAEMCEAIAGRYLFCHQQEEKLLPASVVAEYVDLKREEIEQQQGYTPGRKQLKEIKEQVIAELLPQAFTKKRRTLAWINKERGWLIVEATSTKRAEDVLEDMRHAFDALPVDLLRTVVNPARAMLDWLSAQEAPERFTIDQDCELVSHAEDEGVVRYANWDLGGEDVQYQLSIGRAPTLLGLTFDERISFILTNRLELKRILLLDVVLGGQEEADDAIAKFDADFTLAAAEIENALEALVGELGGFAPKENPDLVDQARAPADTMATLNDRLSDLAPDVAYEEAKRVVIETGHPSISLIQRHLRIGYNRAARLLEQMQGDGLVSAQKADGTREVIAA